MATSAEFTFMQAVTKAEGVRQAARAAAFATWGFGAGSALTTYIAALQSAENAYTTSLINAISAAGGIGISVPNQGPAAQVGDVILGNTGSFTPPTNSLSTTFGKYA
jgi:hypothetical protein